jgi:hypothetical protein
MLSAFMATIMEAQEEILVFNISHYKNPFHRIFILLEVDIFHLHSPLPCLLIFSYTEPCIFFKFFNQLHPSMAYCCILFHLSVHLRRPLNLLVSALHHFISFTV